MRFATHLLVAAVLTSSVLLADPTAVSGDDPKTDGGRTAGGIAYAAAAGSPIYVGPMTGRPVIGDVNADQNPDIVVACGTCCGSRPDPRSGHIVTLLGDGRGAFRQAGDPIKVASSVRKVALGDLNGDRKLDIVAAEHDTYSVTVLLGDGRGGFAPAPGSPMQAASGGRPHTHEIALADLSGDGKLDVLTTNANGNSISVLLGDGRGGFAPAEGSPFATGRHPYDMLAVQDVNADGKMDVVVPLLAANKVGVLFGDGKGTLTSPEDRRYRVGERPGYVAVGDVNNDQKPDILATHDDVGMVDILLGDGSGAFVPANNSPVTLSTPVWGIAAADLNDDGNLDLVLGALGKHGPVILLGDGKAGFAEARGVELKSGDSPNYVAVGDLNRDGEPDIVSGNYDSGDVSVFLCR